MSEQTEDLGALEDEIESDPSPSAKRLSPADWAQIKEFWELGTHSLQQLSDMFGIRRGSIHEKLKRDGVQKGSRAAEVAAMANSKVEEEAEKRVKRISETKEQHYQWSEALGKLVMNTVINAKNNGRLMTADPDLTALNKAAKTLEVVRKERWAILGLDKEDGDPEDIPEFMISELTAEQIAELHASMRADDTPQDHTAGLDLDDDVVVEEGDE